MSIPSYATLNVGMTKSETTENWDRFGRWVSSERQAANLTQEELAERVGLEKQQIYRIEKGGSTKRATVIKIAQALNANSEHAISLAFGVTDKKITQNTDDQHAQAARAAELIAGFLSMTPERQAQVLALMKVLQSDHPELLKIMTPPIQIVDAASLTESDAVELDDTPP